MTLRLGPSTGQLRLPGQVAAPEGPVDLHLMYLAHHAFRRDLAAFAGAVRDTPADDPAAWLALHSRWLWFAALLRAHHGGQDEGLWPLLIGRAYVARDRGAVTVLLAMDAEHAELDLLLESCERGLANLARGGTESDRCALSVRMSATRESLSRHLGHEEADAMAVLQRYLDDREWQDTVATYFAGRLSRREVWFGVPWLLTGVPEPALRAELDRLGLRVRVLWRLRRRGFARRERRTFRYAGSQLRAGAAAAAQ